MNLDKILAISGKPGLFELKTQTRNGFLVQSLLDGKKLSVNIRHNVSILSEIAIYTTFEEVPLKEIFKRIHEKENGEQTISHKASKTTLEAFFVEILPEYDQRRVYASDIKKIVQWYNILLSKDLFDFSETEPAISNEEEVSEESPNEAE